MKFFVCLVVLILSQPAFSQEDYTLNIDGKIISVGLDRPYETQINGKSVSFTLRSKDTLLYDDSAFSFKYLKDYKVTKTRVDEGIEQVMIMSAEGNGVIIQKYDGLNPTSLNSLLLNEVTKESLNYGFQMKREDYQRKLQSGQTIKVDKAVLKYKDEINTYEVTSLGKKDEGIVVMTIFINEKLIKEGNKIIDLMWKSLNYKQ
jgi:hypothetical protein